MSKVSPISEQNILVRQRRTTRTQPSAMHDIKQRLQTLEKYLVTRLRSRVSLITVLNSLGILMVIFAYIAARVDNFEWISVLYWGGLFMMIGPVIIRLTMSEKHVTRNERLTLIVLLVFNIYLFKVLLSPNFMYLSDEFYHWRNTNDILKTGTLFNPNPILPASAYYPGLHLVSAALADLSGLSIYAVDLILIGMAQFLLVVSLFLLFEFITRSAYIAGLASVIYMANPNFIFYGQQFGYESLSLPLMALAIYLLSRGIGRENRRASIGIFVIVTVLILTIVPTHHMTSYALVAFMAIWTILTFLDHRNWLRFIDTIVRWIENLLHWLARRVPGLRHIMNQLSLLDTRMAEDYPGRNPEPVRNIHVLTVIAFLSTVAWLFGVATITVGYLSPVLGGAIDEVLKLIANEVGAKETFKSIAGFESPVWERYVGFLSVGLICLGLPFGWVQTWRRFRGNIVSLTLIFWSLLYPVTLAMRLTEKGSETANRSSEFLFIGMALVLAVAIVELFLKRGATSVRIGFATTYIVLIFMGGVTVGHAWWARLPGEYVFGGDSRSIQAQGMETSLWAKEHLAENSRMITDNLNSKLMTSYGEQFPIRGVSWILFSDNFSETEQLALQASEIQYLVLDYRVTEYIPINGHFFESGEPWSGSHTEPLNPDFLNKYDRDQHINRIFDSGDIRILDVSYYSQTP